MRLGKRVAKRQLSEKCAEAKKWSWTWLLFAMLVVIGASWSISVAISEAKQCPHVQECQRWLSDAHSFEIKVDNWIEEKAMEQVVDEFNKAHGYKWTDYQYKMYESRDDGYYLITSDFVHKQEFSVQEAKYYSSAIDMFVGLKSHEETYEFVYMTKEQRLHYEEMYLSIKMQVQDRVHIQELRNTINDVTFVSLTIKPKSNIVEGERI